MRVEFTIDDPPPRPTAERLIWAVNGRGHFLNVRDVVGRCRCYQFEFPNHDEFRLAAATVRRFWPDVGIAILAEVET